MKKKLYIISAILLPLMVLAQTTTRNYIKSTSFQIETTSDAQADQKIETITYFDGLGRPLQRVDKQAGGQKQDLITPFAYDYFGREKRQYLPYARTTSSFNFEPTLEADYYGDIYELDDFYANKYPDDFTNQYGRLGNAFFEKYSEASPLSRIRKQSAPGVSWVLNKFWDGDHNIKFEYYANDITNDNVKRFAVSFLNGNKETPNIEFQGFYSDLQLYKTITKNENWTSGKNNTTEEFNDKQGHVILKRSYADYKDSNGQITSSEVSHDTYYVYDIYGNLTFVIPPKAVDLFDVGTDVQSNITSIATVTSQNPLQLTARNSIILTHDPNDPTKGFHAQAGSTFSASIVNSYESILNDLCYQYRYDSKNRLIEKKLPGKGWEYLVYDKLNRPILTQDAILKLTNKWIFTKYDAFGRPVYSGEYVNNSETSQNAVQSLADGSAFQFENRATVPLNINNVNINYSNNAFPKTGIELLTITYYDHYNDIDLDGGTATITYNSTPKGLPVCTKIRVLGTSSWITSVSYFDTKGRNIYTYDSNNFLDATKTVKSLLDFTGKTITATSTHKKGTNSLITLVDDFTYDHIGRLLTQKQKINSQAEETIVSNTYDNLGHLISKIVGGLQTVNYKYNARGWLKSINDINNMGTDLFALQINYDNPTAGIPLYNGNISQILWKTAHSDPSLKSYQYNYDALNRLTDAKDSIDHYNEKPSYDKNGNIITMFRTGNTILNTSNYGTIDNLNYTYDSGNRLLKVEDSSNNGEGFNNGSTGIDTDYSYDINGNMKIDANKGITNISYNYLSLPDQINIRGNNISYIYDATGAKQRKVVNGITTDYAAGFQYENDTLQFFPHSEGYVNYNNGNYEYIYQYKDYLGNIRLSYNKSLNIIEENNYYPFGLKQKSHLETFSNLGNATAQKYKYNGKELQDELGLGLYDYGARNYDQTLGRWINVDPLAEKYFYSSTYTYVCNDPVNYIDPNGMDRYYMNDQGRTVLALKENAADVLFFGGKNNESIVDTNKDGKQDSKDGITIKTKGLLGQLTQQKGEKTSLYTSTVKQSETAENDMLNVFHFAANNTKVEFSLKFYEKGGENLISLGTYNSEWSSPGFGTYGKVKANKGYHNHPYDDIYTSKHTEKNSMGYYGDDQNLSGDSYNAAKGKSTIPNYVFFPESTNLYNITQYGIELIKKINGNYKNLKK